jgi:branched-chain amino acid transport system ATP-binding protein
MTSADRSQGGDVPFLELSDVSVRFGGVVALSGVTFTVREGDVAAVVGPNGAGKSTLLNAISGLARNNMDGTIRLGEHRISGMSPVRIARLGVGRSFQDPRLLESETVLENLLLGAHGTVTYSMADQIFRRRLVRHLEQAATERATALLGAMGLAGTERRITGSLPYGTRKLIDIARAMMTEPKLLLLDEPTSGLDRGEQEAVAELLDALHQQSQMTIVLVEHHLNVVRRVAAQVVGLDSGTVVADGSPDAVFGSAEFRATLTGAESAPASDDIAVQISRDVMPS